jgi:Leishmanolysin
MKRSIALLGLFLPLIEGSTSFSQPQQQHHVRPAKRIVAYGNSRIPVELVNSLDRTESKNEPFPHASVSNGESELFWYVHADAIHEHPDRIIKEALNHRCLRDYDDRITVRSGATLLRRSRSSFLSPLVKFGFRRQQINNTEHVGMTSRVNLDNIEESAAVIDYNVSVGTEYDVSFDVLANSTVGSNITTIRNDTSSAVSSSSALNNNESKNSTNDNFYLNETLSTSFPKNSTPTNKTLRYRPLRIWSILSEFDGGRHLTAYQRSVLLQDVLKPALLLWSAALRVDPVIGNLTVDPYQLVDGKLCGPGGNLPSVIVPTEHFTIGVPDTDFIVYISLAFMSNQTNGTFTTDHDVAGSSTQGSYNSTENGKSTNYGNASSTVDVESNSSDSGDRNSKKQCSGDYLAASSFCSTDQFDRPTAAIMHLCIDTDFFYVSKLQTNIRLVSHELGHALGFNAVSLAHFRRADGTPYTDRDPITGEIPLSEINCTGPEEHRRTGIVALPSSDVLQFRTVRGGVRVAEVVTPSVRQVARNHFDCQDLPGAELESGEFLPLSTNPGEVSCLGDHWERRLFKTDLMNPLIDDNVDFTSKFSTITLAYFADSGWYQVDLSRASLSAGWGRAAGCDFIEETCVKAENGQVPSRFNSFFCNQRASNAEESGVYSEIHGCTTDLTRKASCSLDQYEGELPPAYQYFNFSYGANVGGTDPFMDYCPVYAGFANGLCSELENEALIKVNYIERFGQRNSRCLAGHISSVATISEDGRNASDSSSSSTVLESTALCLPIACVVEDRTLRIQLDGVWKICSHKDELIASPRPTSFYTRQATQPVATISSVVCPDPIRVCPTFYCHRDCLGTNRICDYNIGKCVCSSTMNNNATKSRDFVSWNESGFTNITGTGTSLTNETDAAICGVNNASVGTDVDSSESFYESIMADDNNGLPNSDSPLSDYYYKTERNLKEESSTTFWTAKSKGIISGVGSFLVLIMILFLSYIVFLRPVRLVQGSGGSDRGEENDDLSVSNDESTNPNKDKLMASIVVNLRMNDPILQRMRRDDALGHRDSETDLSMTDTEGTSDVTGSLDFSLESPPPTSTYSGTIVDLLAHDNADLTRSTSDRLGLYDELDNVYVDPLAPPVTASSNKTVVCRRRQVFFHGPTR